MPPIKLRRIGSLASYNIGTIHARLVRDPSSPKGDCRLVRYLVILSPLVVLGLTAHESVAQSADEIRAEWRSLRSYDAPAAGQFVLLAPDDYTGNIAAPADAERASKLSHLAQQAANIGQAALAIKLATEAVAADPACVPARKALGYEHYEGRWLTAYGLRMAKRGLQWNANYGWIDQADIKRYELGERQHRSRWVSAQVDAQQHATIDRGWQIRTDHFLVTTNHSLQAGVQLAAKLEQLYQVWLQLFADFNIDKNELRDRFKLHRVSGVRSRPFQVVYYSNRDEYNQALLSRQPRIAETIGIYFDHQREAHFFFTDEYSTNATLFHESVHQLFNESKQARRDPGLHSNFWAIEGVATWFESLTRHDDSQGRCFYTIGTPEAGRLPDARRSLLEQGYRIPLAELVTLGKTDLQSRSDLAPLYSQAAGLSAFLMSNNERQARFVEYLRQIYATQAEPATLSTLCGKPYAELDAEYRQFLENLPAE